MANVLEVGVFKRNLSTLKDTSFDSKNNRHLSQSLYPAVDFDAVKNDAYTGFNNYRSNDALLIPRNNGEKYVFIEFKNGCITSPIECEKIRTKIAESMLLFHDILQVAISFDRTEVIYILVYNKSKNRSFENKRNSSIVRIAGHFAHLAKTSLLINGFDRYRKIFKQVYTINEDEFKDSFSNELDAGNYPF